MADVLFGAHPLVGTLSFSWPRSMEQACSAERRNDPLFPLGYGLDAAGRPLQSSTAV